MYLLKGAAIVVVVFLTSATQEKIGCFPRPKSFIKEIGKKCEVDIGTCLGTECKICKNDDIIKCCNPVLATKEAECFGETVSYEKVVRCECFPCPKFKVYVSGRISECFVEVPCSDCVYSVRIKGVEVVKADENGDYNFYTDLPADDRVVFTIVEEANDVFFPQIKVVHGMPGKQAYLNQDVCMNRMAKETFQSSEQYGHHLANDIKFEVLPNSIKNPDGSPYIGIVSVGIGFVNRWSEESVLNIPGELVTAEGPLSSLGMFLLSFKDTSGDPLIANDIKVSIHAGGLSEGEREGIALWKLIKDTGLWEYVADMTEPSEKRKKRQIEELTGAVDVVEPIEIFNLDVLVEPYCHMKVRFFEFGGPNPVGVDVTTYYGRPDGSWTNYLHGLTTADGICVSVPCDRQGMTDISDVRVTGGAGFMVGGPTVRSFILTALNYAVVSDDTFAIKIPVSGTVLDSNGPIYDDIVTCSNADDGDTDQYYFTYLKNENQPLYIDFNVVEVDENNIFETWSENLLSWWPNRNTFTACYIKFEFTGNPGPRAAAAVCDGGTHEEIIGAHYGYRATVTQNDFVCVEYKCPGKLSDGKFDRAFITVGMDDFDGPATVKSINNDFNQAIRYEGDSQLDTTVFKFLSPATSNLDEVTGIYTATAGHPIAAKAKALDKCINGRYPALYFEGNTDLPAAVIQAGEETTQQKSNLQQNLLSRLEK